MTEHFDLIIVGAGLSGIGAAYYAQTHCPQKSYTILEGRANMGGTWDLFRYPGIRSDSDMHTLGYSFHPWPNPQAIADGPTIRQYIHDTAQKYGIDQKIRFNHRLQQAAWSSDQAQWTLTINHAPDQPPTYMTCNFLYMCTGYYKYEHGYMPTWPGTDQFTGQLIHPQNWPQNLDYTDKKVVIIGSGATAVTLVPAMAKQAAHVTMLQRSPTYIIAMPSQDALANRLRRHLPDKLAHGLIRWKNIILGTFYYHLMRWQPNLIKKFLINQVANHLGPDYDIDTHFTPRYDPWDQRLCLVPDGDLFDAINNGGASIVTDHIDTFTPTGLRLQSGQELPADIIVAATGLIMRLMSGVDIIVDNQPINLADTITYRGLMFSNIPNLALAAGYTNASWTLKCELSHRYVCRLINYLDQHNYTQCRPQPDPTITPEPAINFTSGYVQRALNTLPRQGSRFPWKLYQNYLLDKLTLQFTKINDNAMTFQ
ncbi:MAG TPA: NAD(P)/FAD-dependent oxidoreductase [Anaerolineae bacterium]|nr:NAD(P)/FAD-dependent oxidoreductase [Anaerolineae bacterium]